MGPGFWSLWIRPIKKFEQKRRVEVVWAAALISQECRGRLVLIPSAARNQKRRIKQGPKAIQSSSFRLSSKTDQIGFANQMLLLLLPFPSPLSLWYTRSSHHCDRPESNNRASRLTSSRIVRFPIPSFVVRYGITRLSPLQQTGANPSTNGDSSACTCSLVPNR